MSRDTPYLPVTRDFAYSADGDAVEPPLSSPPPSSPGTLARFEFEAGRGNEGTKILLVEWPLTSPYPSQASIYWENMPNGGCLSVDDTPRDNATTRRLYLLPAYAAIPRNVYITTAQENLQTNPLPAIFIACSPDNGRKGVLHTTFARRRLEDLEAEIHREASVNPEGVALEMALQEKSCIEQEYFYPRSSHQAGKKEKSKKSSGKSSSPESLSNREVKKNTRVSVEAQVEDEYESESGLFATSMAPRAPDEVMSPYSLRTPDYLPWR